MIYVAVCDDNVKDARFTVQKVNKLLGTDRAVTESFSRPEELLSAIERCGYRPEIAVLDIQMDGGMDGIALANRLNALVPECRIIFLTGFEEFCSEVYRTEHVFFIHKSRVDQYLPSALEKAAEHTQNSSKPRPYLNFSVNGTSYHVPGDEVLYLERRMRKTVIVTKEKEYAVSASPSQLIEQVNEGEFIQCHQSYWVNRRYIYGISAHELQLRDGNRLPLSRSKAQSFKTAYFSSLGKELQSKENT